MNGTGEIKNNFKNQIIDDYLGSSRTRGYRFGNLRTLDAARCDLMEFLIIYLHRDR